MRRKRKHIDIKNVKKKNYTDYVEYSAPYLRIKPHMVLPLPS